MDFRWGFPGGSEVKVSAWNSGDPGLRKMVMMTLYIQDLKRDTNVKKRLWDSERRQGWDDLRE